MKAQPTGNPRKDPSTGYMMDAKLTSTDITKHAAQQTVQPWHSRENKSHYWTQLTGQVGQILEIMKYHLFSQLMMCRWRRRKARVKRDGWRIRRHKLNISRSDIKQLTIKYGLFFLMFLKVWDKFWGRPGYGAPRQSGQNKENLMKMLHYPKQVRQ